MSKKMSMRLLYALVLSILLLTVGLVGFAVYAFASVRAADSIFLASFAILTFTLFLYFILRCPLAAATRARIIWRPSLPWPRQLIPQRASRLRDRRRPLVQGRKQAVVAHERRSTQLPGFRVVNIEPIASGMLRG